MPDQSSRSIVLAALIVGLAIVSAALLVQRSITDLRNEVSGLQTALAELEIAAPAPPTRQAAARPPRPDPNRRYEVSTAQAPAKGPEKAKVTLVEFSDFQCPFCGRVTPTLDRIKKEYGDEVRVVFKHLPLSIHPKSPAAHAAAEAAHRQGKFWEMHDAIFANQREMSEAKYVEWAQELGLDVARFEADRKSPELKKRVDADASEAARLGVTGTPAFFVNGRFLSGAQPFESFKRLIDEELKKG